MRTVKEIKSIVHQQFPFLSFEDVEGLFAISKTGNYKNKEIIFSTDQKADTLYFIIDGIVRGYTIEDNGTERTVFIRPEHTFFAAPGILQNQPLSNYYFETIRKSTLLEIPFLAFQNMTLTNLSVSRLFTEALKENLRTVIQRIEMLAGKSPEDRYENLMRLRPELFQKAPLKYIANYLGMTPNSLSRIVKRKKEGKT